MRRTCLTDSARRVVGPRNSFACQKQAGRRKCATRRQISVLIGANGVQCLKSITLCHQRLLNSCWWRCPPGMSPSAPTCSQNSSPLYTGTCSKSAHTTCKGKLRSKSAHTTCQGKRSDAIQHDTLLLSGRKHRRDAREKQEIHLSEIPGGEVSN